MTSLAIPSRNDAAITFAIPTRKDFDVSLKIPAANLLAIDLVNAVNISGTVTIQTRDISIKPYRTSEALTLLESNSVSGSFEEFPKVQA
jgi:hypothetical protein